jgi:hypothetical protein
MHRRLKPTSNKIAEVMRPCNVEINKNRLGKDLNLGHHMHRLLNKIVLIGRQLI